MAIAIERRGTMRHQVANHQTSLQIMDWIGSEARQATLLNISSTGALLTTDQPPPLHHPIQMRIEIANKMGWVSALPVRVGQNNQVGVRFFRAIPLDFLGERTRERDSMPSADTDDETPLFVIRAME